MKCYLSFFLTCYLVQISICLLKYRKIKLNLGTKMQEISKLQIIREGWLKIYSDNLSNVSVLTKTKHENIIASKFKINQKFDPPGVVPDENSFYFVLNEHLLFYRGLKDDSKVEESVNVMKVKLIHEEVMHILTLQESSSNCFVIVDEVAAKFWVVCTNSAAEKKKWFCAITKIQGKPCSFCKKKEVKPNIELLKRKILKQPMIIIPIPSPFCNEKWNYAVHGDDWECDCKEGFSQSPIDLVTTKIEKLYNRTFFEFLSVEKDEQGSPLKLVFENHKIKIKGELGSMLTFNYVKYKIYEVHFHTRSEHSIDGKFYDLEAQIYYKAITPGYIRKSAAVSILFKITPGSSNLFFDKDINILDLPDESDKIKVISKSLNLEHLFMEDQEDIFEGFNYYLYEGSSTSPPCQEETTWYVVSTPIPVSYTAVEYFKDALRKVEGEVEENCLKLEVNLQEEYLENYRNIQNINQRTVYYYNGLCLNKKKREKPKGGHYEKMQEAITRYFHVNDDKPTGIPNAFVVSEYEAKSFLP